MARQRKGLPVNGWLIFDKPQGMTSTLTVTRVKRLYQAAKAGHAGTLDPLATGVLPIALGEMEEGEFKPKRIFNLPR